MRSMSACLIQRTTWHWSLYFDVQCSGVTENTLQVETNGHHQNRIFLHTSFDVTSSAEAPKTVKCDIHHTPGEGPGVGRKAGL